MIMEGEKEKQGDFVFTATVMGEYRFCFDNTVSTFSDKIVDFEISVCVHSMPYKMPRCRILTACV